jgi:hypothetical protein
MSCISELVNGLKARRGRKLQELEVQHLSSVIKILFDTDVLMQDID